ncbi:uncharacterized protein LOC127094231 [Lathyrus oleraceus]|uniref:uncharacterized protein LOC127094231 n=1 Tax=Pisum sativum TaxID=3888 RepID=UPI0021CE4467|nr:uncharacterized protein LOC127094231 [Pisum sativum]
MTESSFLEKISAYMAENKRQAALEAEITNMANKATYGEIYNTGPVEYSKLKPPDEQVPVEPTEQRLDAIYDEEPLGFEKDPVTSSAKMLAQDPFEEIDLRNGSAKRITYISAKLDPKLKVRVIKLLRKNKDCFAWDYDEMPGLERDLVELKLPIKDGKKPIKQTPRRFALGILSKIKKEVERLLRCNFIRTTRYVDWIENIVPVIKKNGSLRICIDFRDLNAATPKDEYPMPVAEMLVDSAAGYEYLNMLDGYSGYNQIFIAEEDVPKTASRCPGAIGTYEWIVIPFGLKNAEATYQRAMNSIFHDYIKTFMQVYIDDIVIKSTSDEDHLTHLSQSFERMRKHGLKMNPLKCAFFVQAGDFLGFVVHKKGIEINQNKTKAIMETKAPSTKKELQSLLGKINFLRRFTSNLSGRTQAFSPLLRLKQGKFEWNDEQQKAFDKIKLYLTNPPILAPPCGKKPMRLFISTSDTTIEYEALIVGLEALLELGATRVEIKGDSELVIKQLTKEYRCIKENLIMYFVIANSLLKKFEYIDIKHVLRIKNQEANDLAQIASGYRISKEKLEELVEVRGKAMASRLSQADLESTQLGYANKEEFEVLAIDTLIDTDWRNPIINYLKDPSTDTKRKTKYRALSYVLIGNELFKKTSEGILLKCLGESEAYLALSTVHSGACGAHQADHKMKWLLFRYGMYWPTMLKDCIEFAKGCQECQIHAGIQHAPARKKPKNWHKTLDQAFWACRTSPKEATNTTPFQLTFGHDVVLPVEIYLQSMRIQRQGEIPSDLYWEMMVNELVDLDEERLHALEVLRRHKERVARAYNKRVKGKTFTMNDLVWKVTLPMD